MRRIGGWSMAVSLVLAVLLSALAAGCAQDVGDIDRTQADKIKKSLFQNNDEWYYRQTVIDTDMQGSVIAEGTESSLKRIRWEITEDTLYAFSSVPLADGIEAPYQDSSSKRLGAVAAFPITDHFDVQRQYNPQTGEQTNVIVENRSDRPWYDRKYMRVDWSTNLVDGFGMFVNQLGTMASTAYDVPQDDNHIDPDRARIGKNYIDVTTQYTFEPDIYACALNVGALDTIYSCEGGKLRVRNSFMRIKDHKKTFQPFMLTDNYSIKPVDDNGNTQNGALYTTTVFDPVTQYYMEVKCDQGTKDFLKQQYGDTDENCEPATFDLFDRFGYFRTQRIKWNDAYPARDTDREYYANHWQIWKTAYDKDGNLLDPAKRDPKPIVYTLNAEWPKDMIPAATEIGRQWDDAMLDVVRVAQGLDSKDKVKQELTDLYGDPRMFKVVHNNCMPDMLAKWHDKYAAKHAGDRMNVQKLFDDAVSGGGSLEDNLWAMPTQSRVELCAQVEYATEYRKDADAQFTYQRTGDLHYSFINWVHEYNSGWLGYGPSAADPLTGQIISGNANLAGPFLRHDAQRSVDIIQYINGELSKDDIRYGDNVRKYLQQVESNTHQQQLTGPLPAAAKQELARRAGHNPADISPTDFREPPTFAQQDDFIKKWGKKRIEAEANRLSKAITEAKKSDTRLIDFYNKPEVKNFMMHDADFQMAVKALARENFGPNPTDDQLHQAYLDMATPQDFARREQRFTRFLAENNMMAPQNLNREVDSLVTYDGVAQAFKGMDRDAINKFMLYSSTVGTALHEVGHTLGLRHNFSASMDALNYHDGFWKIKRDILDGTLNAVPQAQATDSDKVVIEPNGAVHISDPQLAAKYSDNPDVKYVSTAEMRLGSIMDYTGDMTGRFAGLGKYDKAAVMFVYGRHVQEWADDVKLPNLLWYEKWTRDYTKLPFIYADNPSSSDPEVEKTGIDVMLHKRKWVPIKSAIAEKRDGILANTKNWHNGELSRTNKPYIDRTVPYNFCSDEYMDSQLGCDVFDWGANQTEVVNHQFNTYRFLQPFWRYKGHKIDELGNLYNRYISRVQRTFQVAERPFRYYSIYQWWDLGSYTDDLQRASIDALNFYAEVLATPQPDRYCKWDPTKSRLVSNDIPQENWYFDLTGKYVPNSWNTDQTQCADHIDIGRGAGEYYGFDFTNEYNYRIRRVGTYIDKSLASQEMFNISANYAYSSFFTDARATNISYWTLFDNQLRDFMRGVILGDYTGFAGRWDSTKQQYQAPVVVDINSFGTGDQPSQPKNNEIYTPISFNQEFSTVVGGLLNASSWEDRQADFSNYLKVAVTNDELQPFPQSTDVAKLVHPVTGQIYQAPQTADGKSITYELIQHANDLKTKWLAAKAALDNATPGTDDYNTKWKEERGYDHAFEDTVAKLDMIRFVFDAGNVLR